MSLFTASAALLVIGLIIAFIFHGTAGGILALVAGVGVLYSLAGYAGSTESKRDDVDGRVDDVMRHHPRL